MTASDLSVIKVGGSLAADPGRLRHVLAAIAAGAHGPCIVVPGGGAFADAVRRAQNVLGFDDRLAHRLALAAMGNMAEVFCTIESRMVRSVALPPESVPTLPFRRRERACVGAATVDGRVPVWDPAGLRDGHPDIPETWDVTSDSLALWLAARLRATRCILAKFTDAPPAISVAELARSGLVDAACPDFAARFYGEVVVLGPGGSVPVTGRAAA